MKYVHISKREHSSEQTTAFHVSELYYNQMTLTNMFFKKALCITTTDIITVALYQYTITMTS